MDDKIFIIYIEHGKEVPAIVNELRQLNEMNPRIIFAARLSPPARHLALDALYTMYKQEKNMIGMWHQLPIPSKMDARNVR